MSDSLTAPHAHGFHAVKPAPAETLAEDEPRLPSGWWLLPSVVIGAGMWAGLAALIML